jgi:hypothetical protein
MIDWQVIVNGQNPPNWSREDDGCWFPDFHLQNYLLPIFDVGDQPIDEYDTTVFDKLSIIRLRTHLDWRRGYVEARPDVWTVSETFDGGMTSFEVRCEVVLNLIDKTLKMIEFALNCQGQIYFFGD